MSLAFGAAMLASPALALSAKDCSVKYQAAKQAGTLNGQWNYFQKAECAAPADTSTTPTANPFSAILVIVASIGCMEGKSAVAV
ncbi:hypothetical protein MKK55_09285 [Methylobacterium sp. J-059]|uniref:hypothetical protein n=1 Tax=Methylobacterium sp. J-059 TaxID=2836643 RepID=UPI001FBAF0AC|nr:hypothetical protein [Methylobacterium sp. J-059]MCJ2039138.1 hypothetical protein [Methylobacterium sp. J-059]